MPEPPVYEAIWSVAPVSSVSCGVPVTVTFSLKATWTWITAPAA